MPLNLSLSRCFQSVEACFVVARRRRTRRTLIVTVLERPDRPPHAPVHRASPLSTAACPHSSLEIPSKSLSASFAYNQFAQALRSGQAQRRVRSVLAGLGADMTEAALVVTLSESIKSTRIKPTRHQDQTNPRQTLNSVA
ncbi:hypothetical protein BC936DRAFT_144215 [Jimgerdemannia flammicorona]|uniref:Uncharacterized protein n=1 Tax=Jimgerdemannia flammicorona TaxID=994334 RepID=A0A433DCW7_9FUNG|nr:hypothetical protein BC936DRAFT_144215 [Jimgerdemannia flammicorona]